jgi:4-diphosphocytidyl-2-C-methyl-D-erythritol kinase
MRLTEAAPAKINLFLHVGPAGADGYHPLASLMVFADFGDVVGLEEAEGPELLVQGPSSEGLAADGTNLVARARDAFLDASGAPDACFRLIVDKHIPLAAGLGGGSADAAATLRLLDQLARPRLAPEVLQGIALALGADVPACLIARAVLAQGRGERFTEPPLFGDLDAVLVNPWVACPTREVFSAYDQGPPATADLPALPESLDSFEESVAFLEPLRNDLEAPAIGLRPEIGDALRTLRGFDEVKLARMSGSGATCFGLVPHEAAAAKVAWQIKIEQPDWWVKTCRLRGSLP